MYALLDMDSFYAQVECARLGLSNDVPLGVKQHSHFIAVNYAARKKGVPSRCAVDRAKQICPEIVTAEVEMLHDVKPCLERYRRASEAVLSVLLEFFKEDQIEKASIDEAYIDLRLACMNAPRDERIYLREYEKVVSAQSTLDEEQAEERVMLLRASDVMAQVRERIVQRLGFTSSCGIARNKFLAKIAAAKNKPAGQTMVFSSGARMLMESTSLGKIRGLGGKFGKQLVALLRRQGGEQVTPGKEQQYNVLGAVQRGELSFAVLEKEFGTSLARYIISRANGEDDSPINARLKPNTHLSMKTFYQPIDFAQVQEWLHLESKELAGRIVQDCRLFNRRPQTLVLHFHRNDGTNLSRRTAFHANELANASSLAEDIYRASETLLRNVDHAKEGARGVGIGMENFAETSSSAQSVPKITTFFNKADGQTADDTKTAPVWLTTDDTDDEVSMTDADDGDLKQKEQSFTDMEEQDDLEEEEQEHMDDEGESLDEAPNFEDEAALEWTSKSPATAASTGAWSASQMRPQTSREAGASAFVTRFFKASRLSFIGSWKRRFESLLDSISAPPPLPPAPFNERIILHVDMDAFFCSASLLKRPELVGQPVAVCWSNAASEGASSSASEISSCNYVARSRGVKASMSLARAKRFCPDLICVPFDFELYERIGMIFYRVLFATTPHVEGVSCDEAYLDITHLVSDKRDAETVAEALRARIFTETGGVTASTGSGRNRLIARLSTAKAKPNKSLCSSFLSDDNIFTELLNDDVAVGSLPSIGWSTCEKLKTELDVSTVRQLREVSMGRLKHLFGPKTGEKMFQLCRGIDNRPWNPRPERDTVSVQISWGVRMQNLKEVHDFIAELSRECYHRLGARSGDSIVLRVWRAVENQPNHMRKGQIGSGICDVLTKSKPQLVRGSLALEPTSQKNMSPSNDGANHALENAERLLLDAGLELFSQMRILPEDIRGVGLSITGLAKKFAGNTSSNKRKVATSAAATSKWVEGVGLVANKKKLRDASENVKDADMAHVLHEQSLREAVETGDGFCCEIVEHELVYAFEYAHCAAWPTCQQQSCDCLRENCNALAACCRLIQGLIQRGASKNLARFARWKAQAKWGTVPDEHPATLLSRAGGGMSFLLESLDDMNCDESVYT